MVSWKIRRKKTPPRIFYWKYDYFSILKLSTGPIRVANSIGWDKKSHLRLSRQPKFAKDIRTDEHYSFYGSSKLIKQASKA